MILPFVDGMAGQLVGSTTCCNVTICTERPVPLEKQVAVLTCHSSTVGIPCRSRGRSWETGCMHPVSGIIKDGQERCEIGNVAILMVLQNELRESVAP